MKPDALLWAGKSDYFLAGRIVAIVVGIARNSGNINAKLFSSVNQWELRKGNLLVVDRVAIGLLDSENCAGNKSGQLYFLITAV